VADQGELGAERRKNICIKECRAENGDNLATL